MPQNDSNLVWIDLEMTGLDTLTDHIIEIATVITDKELNILSTGPVYAINQSSHVLEAMDEWNCKTHGESGLIKRIADSGVSLAHAEKETLEFLTQYVKAGISPMCGNSVCQDRRFLHRQMPKLYRFFHYRNLDVSTIKELAARWQPQLLDQLAKDSAHTALADTIASIDEMKFYRQNFIMAK